MTDVCVLGADHPDAIPFLWALRVLNATVSTTPCDARIRVLFGPIDATQYVGARTVFVPTHDEEDLEDLLDRPGLWIAPTIARAQHLMSLATGKLHTLVLPWSHPSPVRYTPLNIVNGPIVAHGSRAAIPRRRAYAATENSDATLLVAPSNLTSLMEALHKGIPIADFDDSPLADCLIPGHNGILFSRSEADSIVERILSNSDQLRRLTCPQPGHLFVRQQRFIRLIREHVLAEPATRIRFFQRQRMGQRRATGYRVKIIKQLGIKPTWTGDSRFVLLGGRVPVDEVKKIASSSNRPIVLAMNDGIRSNERLEWFVGVARFCKLMFVADPPEFLPRVDCPVLQLHAVPNVDGAYGTALRPPEWPDVDDIDGPDIIFLANTLYPRRMEFIRQLARHVRITMFGRGNETVQIPGVDQQPFQDTASAMRLMRSAKVTLSVSADADREKTSNRLFNAGAAGACILAEAFPNCRTFYPDHAVCWFFDVDEAVEGVQMLLNMDTTQMRWAAQEITWRRYTGHDRMMTILRNVEKHLGIRTLWPT